MTITEIKEIIKNNPHVILYLGADWQQFTAITKATNGFLPNYIEGHTELCLLYAGGKYDGFNREDSIEFFKMNFAEKKAYYKRWVGVQREEDDEWLLVDLSRDRRAKVV